MNFSANGRVGLRLRGLQAIVLALLAAGIVFGLSGSIGFSDFDAWTYDIAVVHAGISPPSRQILMVDFDEATFAQVRQFPIPRALVAETIRRIAAGKPRVIGVDIFSSETRAPAEDAALTAALTAAGNVILASQLSTGILPDNKPLPIFCQPEDSAAVSGFCVEGTPGANGYAFINLPGDPDGYIRRATVLAAGMPPSLSFPVVLAQQFTGTQLESVDRARARFNGHTLVYASPELKTFLIGSWSREPATHLSALSVLRGEVPASTFTDKLVLVGQSNDAARDLHLTPLYRTANREGERLRMAGTEIHAAAIRSLIEGTVVRPAVPAVVWSWVVAVCALGAWAMLRLRLSLGALAVALLAVLVFAVSLVLYARARVWLPYLPPLTGLVVVVPFALGLQFVLERTISRAALLEQEQLMGLFSSYVDPAVAQTIWQRRREVSLAGEERVATVMFSDIRSFTALSAGRPPAEVLGWLNRYLTAMDEVIREHDGFLNKFIGDGLMIIFGLPLTAGVQTDAERCVQAGLAMLARVEAMNAEAAGDSAYPQLRIGLGIHTGPLMAGSIGSALRQEYSVIGATVNLASRLESLNKPMKTELLMSEATYMLVRDRFPAARPLGPAQVAGLSDPVDVFTLALSAVAVDPAETLQALASNAS